MSESRRSEIIRRLGEIGDLPTLPQVVTRLQEEMASPNSSTGSVSEIIRQDPAISIKALKVANSPLYGLGRKVTDIRDAVRILGLKEVYNIVMSMSTLNLFKNAGHINYKAFWRHCLSVAFATKAIAEFTGGKSRPVERDELADLFIAGLLHDIGILVLDQYVPEHYEKVLQGVSEFGDVPLYGVEYEVLGISHGEVGEFLMNKWYIPDHIATAVAFHHKTEDVAEEREHTQILHIADFICNNQGLDNGLGVPPTSFSDDAWENLGLSVDDISEIIDKVRLESENSAILLALA
ncbi:MAG: HDOD domain-containing protein [Thermodesulfobacteriota bacterium]